VVHQKLSNGGECHMFELKSIELLVILLVQLKVNQTQAYDRLIIDGAVGNVYVGTMYSNT